MVYFSCNACGQSVKKNQVEKHYQLQCRNCEVLSCVDCGKEFRGDDYQGHTRCISEEVKYGSKDVKQNLSVNKGEIKQDKWIENIQSTIAAAKVSRPIFNLLERLLTYSNIPRKKVKFEKFVLNSLKVFDPRLIAEIWDIVNVVQSDKSGQKDVGLRARAQVDTERCTGGPQEGVPSKQSQVLDSEDVKNMHTECEQVNCIGKKKKRKSKTPEKAKMETCENCKGEGCANCEENYKPNKSEHEQAHVHSTKKKKHKRKKEASDGENGVETVLETIEPVEECTVSSEKNCELEKEQHFPEAKKKKPKRKKGAEPDEKNTVGELEGKIDANESNEDKHKFNGSGYDDSCSIAKKKKKHKRDKGKASEENGIRVDENEQNIQEEQNIGLLPVDCDQTKCVTKKKKKHKHAFHEEMRTAENDAQVVFPGDPKIKKLKRNEVDDAQTEVQCTEVNGSSKKKKSKKSKK